MVLRIPFCLVAAGIMRRLAALARVMRITPVRVRKRIFFTGSGVVISMLEKYEDKIPFITTVKKIDKYYTLT